MKNNYLKIIEVLMRLTFYGIFIQILCLGMLYASTGEAQKSKSLKEVYVELNTSEATLMEVFSQIESQTGFSFNYDKKSIDKRTKVNLDRKAESVEQLLIEIGHSAKLHFRRINNNISVSRASEPFDDQKVVLDVADVDISGKITDENGEGLPGASIVVKGTSIGITTDLEGKYKLSVPQGSVLAVSFVGYKTIEVEVLNQAVIDILMVVDTAQLDEIIVIGYGTQERAKVTSAISEIDTRELKNLPLSQPEHLLQGRASGITVRDNNGAPGSSPTIQIHGISSINAGVGPLVIIDGTPVGDMPAGLSANDIEKITILKDAASTSIYGARGSNGVILIETVRAKESHGQVEYTISGGYNSMPQNWRPTFLNAQQYAQYNVERVQELNARNNQSNPVPQIYLDVLNNPNYGPGTNWQDEVFQEGSDSQFQNHNVTFRGGNENLRAAVSAGYLKQDGILPNTNFKRYSLRTNVDGKFSKWLNAGANLSVSHTERNNTPQEGIRGILMTGMALSPLKSPYDENGELIPYIAADSPGYFAFANPLFKSKVSKDETIGRDIFAGANLDIKIIEGLHFRPRVYTRLFTSTNNTFVPTTVGGQGIGNASNLAPNGPPQINSASNVNSNITNWGVDYLLSYDKSIGEHSFGALIGYTAQKESGERSSISASNFPSDKNINFLEASQVSASVTDGSKWSLAALFARVNYDYNSKYLFELNVRREGSSRFGVNNKYGVFPAASVGWRISEEAFFPKEFTINELKLRSSYGITGNSAIGDFDQYGSIISVPSLNNLSNNNNYVLNNTIVTGKALTSLGSANLKWETATQFDIGLTIGLLKDRIGLKIDYYEKVTNDMLFNVSIPKASGFGGSRINIGEMLNKGWDFEAVGNFDINKFTWRSNLNVSILRNKVISMPEQIERIISGSDNVTQVGSPVGSLFAYQIDGIFNTQEQLDDPALYGWPGAKDFGAYIYRDINGDGRISAEDKTIVGNPHPRTVLGFNNQFSYNNLSLSILVTGSFGYQIVNALYETTYNEKSRWNVDEAFLDRWKSPENPGAGRIPAIFYPGQHFVSNIYVEEGSHLWVKNVTLGYELPSSLLDKTGFVSNVRFFTSVQNLFKITEFTGFNPEESTGGGNPTRIGVGEFAYPVPRTFTIGASITL